MAKRKPFENAILNLKEKIKFWISSGMSDQDIMMQILNTPFTTEVFRKMDKKEPVNLWPDVIEYSMILKEKSRSEEDRLNAVIRLSEIASKFSVQALEHALLFDKAPMVRFLSAQALGQIHTQSSANALANAYNLEHEIKHPNQKLSYEILIALNRVGDKKQKEFVKKNIKFFQGESQSTSKETSSSKPKSKRGKK